MCSGSDPGDFQCAFVFSSFAPPARWDADSRPSARRLNTPACRRNAGVTHPAAMRDEAACARKPLGAMEGAVLRRVASPREDQGRSGASQLLCGQRVLGRTFINDGLHSPPPPRSWLQCAGDLWVSDGMPPRRVRGAADPPTPNSPTARPHNVLAYCRSLLLAYFEGPALHEHPAWRFAQHHAGDETSSNNSNVVDAVGPNTDRLGMHRGRAWEYPEGCWRGCCGEVDQKWG